MGVALVLVCLGVMLFGTRMRGLGCLNVWWLVIDMAVLVALFGCWLIV